MLTDEQFAGLIETRAQNPDAILDAARSRRRRSHLDDGSGLLLVAADHTGRGIVGAGDRPLAIGDRRDLLGRLVTILEHPAVDGVMATADIIDELLLLGALHDKVVVGSMNRGAFLGSVWEMDDRFNCYDTEGIVENNLDGGKMLLRIDPQDPGTNPTIEACGKAVNELGRARVMAMVEPLPYTSEAGKRRLVTDTEALVKVVSAASAMGSTSAYTWLKLPAVDDMETVMAATTMPTLLLGGDPGKEAGAVFAKWEKALASPQVRGLVAGRAFLYPPDDDVHRVINLAAQMMGRPGV